MKRMLGVGRFKVNGPQHEVNALENESKIHQCEHADRMLRDDCVAASRLIARGYLEFSTESR
jgi:hypothetical protein